MRAPLLLLLGRDLIPRAGRAHQFPGRSPAQSPGANPPGNAHSPAPRGPGGRQRLDGASLVSSSPLRGCARSFAPLRSAAAVAALGTESCGSRHCRLPGGTG